MQSRKSILRHLGAASLLLTLGTGGGGDVEAAEPGNAAPSSLPPTGGSPWADYAKILPKVVQGALPVDSKLGYLVKEVKPGVHVITDGIWQSAFVVTNEGVIVLDAPESFAPKLPAAIASVTEQPVRILVYTHAHKDHIGGSAVFAKTKGLEIIALDSVKRFLEEKNDPNRLLPTTTFQGRKILEMGGKQIVLKNLRNYHSDEGDVIVHMPKERFLMAIDALAPGYVPFMSFDLTSNFHEYMKIFDDLLDHDFDVFVGGHLTQLGTREDVAEARKYVRDVYETTKRVHAACPVGKGA